MIKSPDFSDNAVLEQYSSTFTLSDMEIFVFPQLLYSLVIANILSPILWKWHEDPWFENIHKKSFTYKVNRIKQYIMDHYVFNLDLNTWGLTTKETEINRFNAFIDTDIIRQSNALFGYEGDKYYFDIDIRHHFGLDSYNSNIIPYWKTETIEAMTAYKYKTSFTTGAGECVSFSALYVAALFIVGRIPLENLYIINTPLHSQNFVDINDGVLTNNRRLVTKAMWFNGTSLSTRARRAIENEQITIVSHISGYIHCMYNKATINSDSYNHFADKLKAFLSTKISSTIFINFLRFNANFKKCFQFRHIINGHQYYIGLDKVFEYEHQAKQSFTQNTREALINEIEEQEFSAVPLLNRIIIQNVEEYLTDHNDADIQSLMNYFVNYAKATNCNNVDNITLLFNNLSQFITVIPQLPDSCNKHFEKVDLLTITTNQSRNDILQLIQQKAASNELALLSLYTYRDMEHIDWLPFIKASLERNPVSLDGLKNKTFDQVYTFLCDLPNESIYEGKRLAQPDEVWNFKRGDGIEKALLLANVICNTSHENSLTLSIESNKVTLQNQNTSYSFISAKDMNKQLNLRTGI